MEGTETPNDLYKHIPDLLLFNVSLALLIVAYFLEYVAIVSILHDQAQTRSCLVDKSVAVCNNIWMVDRSEDPDLIKGIHLLLFIQWQHGHSLESIDVVISLPPHSVNFTERPTA